MKKLLLSLGTAAAAVAPLATVVACGDDTKSDALVKPSYDAATQMLINDIPEYTHHANQFGSSRAEAIKGIWSEIQTKAKSAQEVAEMITVAAYPESIESDGWEVAVEQSMIRLLGGTNSWGDTVEGWAYHESQRLQKDILFADLEETVAYEKINVALTSDDILGQTIIVDNADGTNTVSFSSTSTYDLSSDADLDTVAEGSDITVTATAKDGYTVNGEASDDFTVTINAPAAVAAGTTEYGFHNDDATAGEDHSSLFEAIDTVGAPGIKVYSQVGIANASTSNNYNVLKIGSSSVAGAIKFSNPGATITSIEIKGAGWSDTALSIIGGADFAGTNLVTEQMTQYNGASNADIGVTADWASNYTFDFSSNPITEGTFILTTDRDITGGGHTSVIIEDIIITTA